MGTGITAQQMHERLSELLAPTALEVIDAGAEGTGFGTHFRVRIASPMFAGKPNVACHRLVYDALRPFIDRGLHALAIETL